MTDPQRAKKVAQKKAAKKAMRELLKRRRAAGGVTPLPVMFHQVMVHICDTYQLTHPQMMALRTALNDAFQSQPVSQNPISHVAFAQAALDELADGVAFDDLLAYSPEEWRGLAEVADEALTDSSK